MKESVTQLAGLINDRFEQFLLSEDEAIVLSGRKTKRMMQIEDSEQFEARRELLIIEELANKKREEEASEENSYISKVERIFHDQLTLDLEKRLKDIPDLMHSMLKLDPSVGKLLDVLYTESCSISRLEKCMQNLTWLEKSIINFIRQPKYRRLDSQGHPLIIKTLRGALSFIGIESLRKLIPVLIAKNVMPQASDYTPDLKKHLWLYTIGTGNVARTLAPKLGIKPHVGFNLGLLSALGRAAIASLYVKTFDLKLRDAVIHARKKNDVNMAKTLVNLAPSQKYIISFWKNFSPRVTADIVAALKMQWLMLSPGFSDYTRIREIRYKHLEQSNLHPLCLLLFKSQGYMQFKMLQRSRLISKDVCNVYLKNYGINADDMASLANVNLSGLELQIAEKIEEEP